MKVDSHFWICWLLSVDHTDSSKNLRLELVVLDLKLAYYDVVETFGPETGEAVVQWYIRMYEIL